MLDLAKVADILLLVVPPEGLDFMGDQLFSLFKSQSLPTCISVLTNTENVLPKNQKDVKKQVNQFFSFELGEENKCITIESDKDFEQLIRVIANSKLYPIHWRETRPYLLADKVDFEKNSNSEVKTTFFSLYSHIYYIEWNFKSFWIFKSKTNQCE